MATREILRDGEHDLSGKSRVVTDFNKRLHILLDDMRETLIEANGLGLAAPQVGVFRRAVLIVKSNNEHEGSDRDVNDDDDDDDDEILNEEMDEEQYREWLSEQIIELVNPEIIIKEGEQSGSEGCLSVPGVYGIVTRPETVVVRAQNRHGDTFELEVSNLAARAVCHEVDHLDGVLFTSLAERFLTEEELAELRARHEKNKENGAGDED